MTASMTAMKTLLAVFKHIERDATLLEKTVSTAPEHDARICSLYTNLFDLSDMAAAARDAIRTQFGKDVKLPYQGNRP